jgi:hypothetical protein
LRSRTLWSEAEELLESRKLSYVLGAAEDLLVESHTLLYALRLTEKLLGGASSCRSLDIVKLVQITCTLHAYIHT